MTRAAVVLGACLLVAGVVAVVVLHHPASPAPVSYTQRPTLCRQENPLTVHHIGQAGLTWQYADAGEQRELHVGPCAVVIAGDGQSVILAPSGKVVATS